MWNEIAPVFRLLRPASGRGFTLVEIMIVVAILGIIAAIVVPQFNTSSNLARVSATVKDLRTFETAINVYAMKNNGQMPETNQELYNAVQAYVPPNALNTLPGVGGEFRFHSYHQTNTAAISVTGASVPHLLIEVDRRLDDGDLDTGHVRGTAKDEIFFYAFGPVPQR